MIRETIRRVATVGAAALGAAALLLAPKAHADPFEVTQDRYITISQDYDNLAWTVTRVIGDPLDPRDDFLPVLLADNAANVPVQATFIVSSPSVIGGGGFQQFRFGETDNGALIIQNPTLSPDGRTIVSVWQIPPDTANDPNRNIVVTLKISVVRDLARAEWTIENRGNSRSVGLRLGADPSPDPTDTVFSPTFVPPDGFFTNETDFRPNFTPQRPGFQLLTPTSKAFQFFPVDPEPYSISMQQYRGLDATPPDRFILAGFTNLIGGNGPPSGGAGFREDNGRVINTGLNFYDYVINPARFLLGPIINFGDPTYGAYYGPFTLGGGRTKSIVTYYGVGNADHALAVPRGGRPDPPPAIGGSELYVGAVETAFSLPLIGGIAGTNTSGGFGTFRTDGWAMNLRNNLVIPGVVAQLGLPVGLELDGASPSGSTVPLGDLAPYDNAGDEGQATWTIKVNGEQAGVLPVNVSFDSPLGTAAVTRQVNVPQGIIYVFRKPGVDGQAAPSMYTFPFTFANPDPDFVFGLNRAAGDYQIFRWNPLANGGLGQYEAVTQLVAGESYWIQLLGVAADKLTVTLNGATPINIPGSGIGPGGSYATLIQQFWNMVGNPSPYAVLLKDVRFQDPRTGQILDFDNAVRAGFMAGSVWRFNRFTGQYQRVGMWDYVNPGDGVWMFATRPVTIFWPAPRNLNISIS